MRPVSDEEKKKKFQKPSSVSYVHPTSIPFSVACQGGAEGETVAAFAW